MSEHQPGPTPDEMAAEAAAKMRPDQSATPGAPVVEPMVDTRSEAEKKGDEIKSLNLRPEEKIVVDSLLERHTVLDAEKVSKAQASHEREVKGISRRADSARKTQRMEEAKDRLDLALGGITGAARAEAPALAHEDIKVFLSGVQERLHAGYVSVDQAWEEAHAAKYLQDKADKIRYEQDADGKLVLKEPDSMTASEKRRIEGLQASAYEASNEAGKTYVKSEADRVAAELKREKLRDEKYVKAITDISGIKSSESAGAISGLKGVDDAETTQLAADVMDMMDVDKSSISRIAEHGNILRNNKTVDIYRESSDEKLKDVIFVEQIDPKTGETIRLDVVKEPRTKKPFYITAERHENNYQKKIDSKLAAKRVGDDHVSGLGRRGGGSGSYDGSSAGVLLGRGMAGSAEDARRKVGKKQSKPWWRELFSGSGN